jgi:hypothetical protein
MPGVTCIDANGTWAMTREAISVSDAQTRD